MVSIGNYLASAVQGRDDDAARVIADEPTVARWWRGTTDLGNLTVRLSLAGRIARDERGVASSSLVGPYAVFAPAGTGLKAEDRLVAGGHTFRIVFVPPFQTVGVQAAAEVLE